MRYSYLDSPIGTILLVGRPGALCGLYVADHEGCPPVQPGWVEDDDALADARAQVAEYFAGERSTFDLTLELEGTPFQREVWDALLKIPFGETWSYGELAAHLGRPGSARAVGAANGRNPVSIVVPCHRVIGANGSLTGFGWGTDRKSWLLEHERRQNGGTYQLPLAPPPEE